MMTGNRKEEEEREHTVLLHVIRKSPTPIENRLKALQYRKRPKSILGFKPRLPNLALPLYQLRHHYCYLYTVLSSFRPNRRTLSATAQFLRQGAEADHRESRHLPGGLIQVKN